MSPFFLTSPNENNDFGNQPSKLMTGRSPLVIVLIRS